MPAYGSRARRFRLLDEGGYESAQCQWVRVQLQEQVYIGLLNTAHDLGMGVHALLNLTMSWAFKTGRADKDAWKELSTWAEVGEKVPRMNNMYLRLFLNTHMADRFAAVVLRVAEVHGEASFPPRVSSRLSALITGVWRAWQMAHPEYLKDVLPPDKLTAEERDRLVGLYPQVRRTKVQVAVQKGQDIPGKVLIGGDVSV
jgi:hypothetical protein